MVASLDHWSSVTSYSTYDLKSPCQDNFKKPPSSCPCPGRVTLLFFPWKCLDELYNICIPIENDHRTTQLMKANCIMTRTIRLRQS